MKKFDERIINLLNEFQKYWDAPGKTTAEWRIRKQELASITKEIICLVGGDVSLVQEYANTPEQKKMAERLLVFYKGNRATVIS